MTAPDVIASVWKTLGGDPGLLDRLTFRGAGEVLPARLPVRAAARACVAVCSLAAAEFTGRDGASSAGGTSVSDGSRVTVDDGAVATAFLSERRLRIDGRAPESFAPLSRMWRTADGWVRTHANYPWHREALLSALGVAADPDAVESALAERRSVEIEDAVYAAGGLAVALRTPQEWAAHEQGAQVARRPLLTMERIEDTSVRGRGAGPAVRVRGDASAVRDGAGRPRVLDLTRVLAGPVATRSLALLGADVLRIDTPERPELADQHADTGFGKASTLLDLRRTADRRTFEELLADADVVVTGYRHGALDRFGLSPAALTERRPGLVVARLSAWGGYGPWAGRRGFDSLVQVATGIAAVEGGPDRPGVLPAQALDHGTGYLLAAAVLRALTQAREAGGSWQLEFALAQTAHWLCGLPAETAPEGSYDAGRHLAETDSALGRLRHARSPLDYAGAPANWRTPPGVWGTDPARWAG